MRPFFNKNNQLIKRSEMCRLFTGLGILLSINAATAQDIHFSQFFEAPLLRNPSLAGIFTGDLRFQAVYRSQYGSVTVPYQTGSINGEYKKPVGSSNDFLTIGGQFVYDIAGTTNFKTLQIFPALNYHKSLSGLKNRYLSFGFMGGYVQRSIDPTKITTNSQFDGSGYNASLGNGEPFVNYNLGYWDGSVGASFNTGIGNEENQVNNLFVGVAYHHFNRPKNSFYKDPTVELQPKWVASLGVRFALNEQSYFTLQADYTTQGKYQETIGGAMYTFALGDILENALYKINFGGFIRWKDAIIPVVKLDYNPFSISFSYDANFSQLKQASRGRGGFEISITHVSFSDRNSTKDAVLCPKF